jgi:hypothetical protein
MPAIIDSEKNKKIIQETNKLELKTAIKIASSLTKFGLFLVSIPLVITSLLIYAFSFIVPNYLAIIVGIGAGMFISSLYFDKVEMKFK